MFFLQGGDFTERAILHVDCNKFYASVECLYHPELRHRPVVVGGSEKSRHGIVLTKNEIAAKYNIKTGEAIWQARQKCRDLVTITPHFPLYQRFSRLTREIYADYTDLIEPFGLDEAWLDVTGSIGLYGHPAAIANEIRLRVKRELGITVSVGVSYNKVFAKLGSDYKKPDALTVITRENYRKIVWPLTADNLLYIGPATYQKLQKLRLFTIGDVATAPPALMKRAFGKIGLMLSAFANGEDCSPVSVNGYSPEVKSIGNSTTTPRDLQDESDVKMVLYVLCESVARRLRDVGFRCRLITLYVRDNQLCHYSHQRKLAEFTASTREITEAAMSLFRESYCWANPVRSIGVSVSDFCSFEGSYQLSLFSDVARRAKAEKIDKVVDELKSRYGNYCIQRAVLLRDTRLSGFNPYNDHTIHPVGFLNGN